MLRRTRTGAPRKRVSFTTPRKQMVPAGIPTSGPNFVDPERVDVSTFVKEQIRIGDNMKKKFDEAITLDHNYFRMKTLN